VVPKSPQLIQDELTNLESSVYGYLSFQLELAEETDPSAKILLQKENIVEPEPLRLVRRMQVFAGPNGGLPFLVEGAYMDQPYCMTLLLEACIAGERRFLEALKRDQSERALSRQNAQPIDFTGNVSGASPIGSR
jgi:hypothetical protein